MNYAEPFAREGCKEEKAMAPSSAESILSDMLDRSLGVRHSRTRVLVLVALVVLLTPAVITAQTVAVGAGSYTTAQPAGTSGPPATIFRTGSGPVRTHQ